MPNEHQIVRRNLAQAHYDLGMRPHSCSPRLALLAGAVLLAAPSAALAANGSVAGSLSTKPAKQAQASVLATSLADGGVVSASAVSAGGTFKVSLPAGAYAISTVVVPAPGGGATSTGAFPVSLKSGQKRTKIKVTTKKAKTRKGKKSALASRSYVQEKGQVTPGVPAFAVEDFTGAPPTGDWQFMNQALTDLLITDLVGKTPCKTAVVANQRDRKLLEHELELQKSKYFDPKTRSKRNFIISDLTVSGTISVAADGQSAAVNVTITDARTGQLVDSFPATLPHDGFFEAEEQLAKSVAERVCRRPAAYELTLAVNGQATFATHAASGTVNTTLTALRSGGEAGQPPAAWSGVGPLAWEGLTVTSKTPPCTYAPEPNSSSWSVSLGVVGDTQVQVDWSFASAAMATFTVTCPSDDGPPAVIAGQAGPALIGIAPTSATLPLAGGTVPLAGGITQGTDGWTNTGQLVVKPIWAADAP